MISAESSPQAIKQNSQALCNCSPRWRLCPILQRPSAPTSHALKPAAAQSKSPHTVPTGLTRSWLVLLCLLLTAPAVSAQVVRYPQSFPGFEERDAYALELLQLALD